VSGVYARLAAYLEAGEPVALATVIASERAGAKLLVPPTGEVIGGIDPALDARIADDCRAQLAAERSEMRRYAVEGGELSVFIESFPRPPRLIIVGAVHTAIPLHRLAKEIGYHVAVVDARGGLATRERFPEADILRIDWPDDALLEFGLDSSTAVVVLTHDPKFDEPALLSALASDAFYIGAIGSRTTNEQRRASLLAQGISAEQLARIHAPIGLDIGSRTPAEIALAILAEVVAVRHGRRGGRLSEALA